MDFYNVVEMLQAKAILWLSVIHLETKLPLFSCFILISSFIMVNETVEVFWGIL